MDGLRLSNGRDFDAQKGWKMTGTNGTGRDKLGHLSLGQDVGSLGQDRTHTYRVCPIVPATMWITLTQKGAICG